MGETLENGYDQEALRRRKQIKLMLIIMLGVSLLELLVFILLAIGGGNVFGKFGEFPGRKSFFEALFDPSFTHMINSNGDSAYGFWGEFFWPICGFVLSVKLIVVTVFSFIFKDIVIGIVLSVADTIIVTAFVVENLYRFIGINMSETALYIICGILPIIAIVVSIIALKVSGFWTFLIAAVIQLALEGLVIPFILLWSTVGLESVFQKVISTIGGAVGVILLIVFVALSVGGASRSSSVGNNDEQRKKEKIKNRMADNNYKNYEAHKSIREHNKGTIGYGYVDPRVTRRSIEKREEENKYLQKELDELEKKK